MTDSPSTREGAREGAGTTEASPTLIAGGGGGATAALLVVLFGSFMDLLDATIVTVAAPAIAQDLGAGDAQIQWTIAAYTLALGAGLITGGRLGDQYGRKRLFMIGLAGFMVTSALCALAADPAMLIGMRAAQGLTAGIMIPQVFGIIRASFAPGERAKAFGAYGAVQGLASVAGPLLGGLLVEADLFGLGWRTIFWINVPVSILALIIGAKVLPESRSASTARLDLPGALLAATGILLLLLPIIQTEAWGWTWGSYALLAAGIIVLAIFLAHERRLIGRGHEPVFDPALLRIRAFAVGLGACVLFFGGIGSYFLTLSVYLQNGTGRTAWETGLVIVPYALGSIVTSGLGVALAAKAGRALLIAGSLTIAASQLVLWFIVKDGDDPGYWLLALPLFIGGLGLGLAAPVLVNVVLAGVPGRNAGAAGGVLSTVNQIGGAAGIAVLGTLFFTSVTGSATGAPALPDYGHALGIVLIASAALYLITALVMLALPKAAVEHSE
ncbi:MFS transporter [Nonomuraea angiospora]|uniref:EmrB/QacA subfamily drug resistance transporter n=1 Tax=Nonomuraea angiospora TaxID=46172 RepID=A0ABR9MK53_9ACTN|nr:MFS transporter [Nonomuraea angiospora]MBE1593314.1 EmrB/QacA subfamily drug resistance transporter [Nonomuraea angiospora]